MDNSQKTIYSIISQLSDSFESSFGPHGGFHILVPKRDEKLVKNFKEKMKLCTDSYQLIHNLEQHLRETGDGCKSILIILKQIYREAFKFHDQGQTNLEICNKLESALKIALKQLDLLKLHVNEYEEFRNLKGKPVYFLFRKGPGNVTIQNGFTIQLHHGALESQEIEYCRVLFLDLKESNGKNRSELILHSNSERRDVKNDKYLFMRQQAFIIEKEDIKFIFHHAPLSDYLTYHFSEKLIHVSKNLFDGLVHHTMGKVCFDFEATPPVTIVKKMNISTDSVSTILHIPSDMCHSIIIQEENRLQMNQLKKSTINKMNDEFYVPGGGSIEMSIASHLFQQKNDHCDALANVLQNSIPLAHVKKSSQNEYKILSEWRIKIQQDHTCFDDGTFLNPTDHQIYDSYHVKVSIYQKALSLFKLLFNLDGIIKMENQDTKSTEISFDPGEMETTMRRYNRFVPSIEKGISKEQKERMKRKEEYFYDQKRE